MYGFDSDRRFIHGDDIKCLKFHKWLVDCYNLRSTSQPRGKCCIHWVSLNQKRFSYTTKQKNPVKIWTVVEIVRFIYGAI